jgi:hypothetical protein
MMVGLVRALRTIGMCAAFAACNGANGGGTPVDPSPGDLQVTIAGLPDTSFRGSYTIAGGGLTSPVYTGDRLQQLQPGSYTITPRIVSDRGIGYLAPPITVQVTSLGRAEARVTYALGISPRSSTNRPDETVLNKVKLLYALPSDGTDRNLDTDGTIHRTISSGQRWLASQTGGRYMRYDVADGALDIAFVRLPRTDAVYLGYGAFIRDTIEKDLKAAGWNQANTLLLVYYDGRQVDRCGSAAWPPALPGTVAGLYLRGAPTSAGPCAGNPFAISPIAAPGYWEFVAQHELFHLLGLVSTAAPNHALSGHVGNDPTDLMYAGSLPWRPATVDVTKTNYYNAAGLPAGVTNFATSPYVVAP